MGIIALATYTGIGLVAGFLGGLLGISGGLVTVPCLFLALDLMGLSTGDLMQLVIGTSMAAMVFNTLVSTYIHHRHQAVQWGLVKGMAPGLVLGCIAGAFVSYLLSTDFLQMIFAFFAIFLGFYLYRHLQVPKLLGSWMLRSHLLNPIGFGVGTIAGTLGIGGGTVFVPILMGMRMSIKNAIGTSTATGFIVSLVGAISYLLFGLGEMAYDHTIGYIYLPAFAVLAVTTCVAAPYGAKMAHRVDAHRLRRWFAMALIALGAVMLLR